MEADTVQGLLGNGAVTLFILALISLYQKLRENRTTLRAGLETREQMRNERDASWINAYRAAAERHLKYDSEVLQVVSEMRYEIQQLRRENGHEPAVFSPLPDAPPLFPEPQPIKE
jgi:hypothetical protein